MKRILLDLNVVLDAVLNRPPHAEAAEKIWAAAEKGEVEALVAAHGVTTIFYLVAHERDTTFSRKALEDLLTVFRVAPVDEAVIRRALALGWRDFEDAVCAASAEAAGCGAIVTRDPRGFAGSSVPVIDPGTAAALLGAGPGPSRVEDAPAVRRLPRRRGRQGARADRH